MSVAFLLALRLGWDTLPFATSAAVPTRLDFFQIRVWAAYLGPYNSGNFVKLRNALVSQRYLFLNVALGKFCFYFRVNLGTRI